MFDIRKSSISCGRQPIVPDHIGTGSFNVEISAGFQTVHHAEGIAGNAGVSLLQKIIQDNQFFAFDFHIADFIFVDFAVCIIPAEVEIKDALAVFQMIVTFCAADEHDFPVRKIGAAQQYIVIMQILHGESNIRHLLTVVSAAGVGEQGKIQQVARSGMIHQNKQNIILAGTIDITEAEAIADTCTEGFQVQRCDCSVAQMQLKGNGGVFIAGVHTVDAVRFAVLIQIQVCKLGIILANIASGIILDSIVAALKTGDYFPVFIRQIGELIGKVCLG